MAKRKKTKSPKQVDVLSHDEAKRLNIPTVEYQAVMAKEDQDPIEVRYPRAVSGLEEEKAGRNRDLDPQLVWRGKDQRDWSDLVVPAPPLYIQEKVHPKVLIDDLVRRTKETRQETAGEQIDLFADFNGLPSAEAKTEFYQHEGNWSNRMILGDSLQVMASLAEREGLRGKVQCIYFDPPYGIKFNSNFQWSTTSRDVRDGNVDHITREPEQVRAFRDTWRDGIHSYLAYLRDRLTVARDLLTETGSIFVQIGDENAHRVRTLMDEIFGPSNYVSQVVFRKTTGKGGQLLDNTYDILIWYARNRNCVKYRPLHEPRSIADDQNLRFVEMPDGLRRGMSPEENAGFHSLPPGSRAYRPNPITNQRPAQGADLRQYAYAGVRYTPGGGTFRTDRTGMDRLASAQRLLGVGKTLTFVRYLDDFPFKPRNDIWDDTRSSGFGDPKTYVVQTIARVPERCLLMTSDPGDLVLDPTCGSGTTACVAEQWGRRWITIDTSRVALALARARVMGTRYSSFLLRDSLEGKFREAELSHSEPSMAPTFGRIRQGFVYERIPHITLKSITNNTEIDVICDKFEVGLQAARGEFNSAVGTHWEEWEIPREVDPKWPAKAKEAHAHWWELRIARQREIDASIAAKAEFEYLYDKPYEDKGTVRVAGPFTVESLSPHRILGVDENDELIDEVAEPEYGYDDPIRDFGSMIVENLRTSGVQQAHKEDRITFSSLTPWPGQLVGAVGRYTEGTGSDAIERRAGIFIGPEFGTVSRPDLVAAAREAGEADFDILIACAFSYDAHCADLNQLGRIRVLKARMNADLHMADDLKNTGKGNLFVIFGEPDIAILPAEDDQIQVKVNGVDVFHPNTGEIRSDGADGIACWFLDTDYNEESFFVRHAYFLGANDPYKSLKTTLKAEIDEEAWESLHSDTSRPFEKPSSGRIAVKVINHLGDEVMKVFRVV